MSNLFPKKAPFSILVTLVGISIEVRSEQFPKAPTPIQVTLLGMTEFLHPNINRLVAVSITALQLLRES